MGGAHTLWTVKKEHTHIVRLNFPRDINIHQCWECDSEGEFYIYEPAPIQPDDYVDPVTGDDVKLH